MGTILSRPSSNRDDATKTKTSIQLRPTGNLSHDPKLTELKFILNRGYGAIQYHEERVEIV